MEARIFRAALVAALLAVSMGASYRTPNFVVQTQSPQLAEQFAKAAEKYRHDLAIEWLGKPMPEWSQPCVMTVRVGPTLGAGGATTFVFDRGEVFGWRMTIQGSRERILDSVLPHEITHMIFASRFRCPLPRWADEGGATSVECQSERSKHYKMLVQFLRSNRGIAFSRMFAMSEYPRDIMPLYAQGYTLCDFLIQKGGRRKFVEFVADGLEGNQWSAAIQRHYGIQGVGPLQDTWLAWVRQGFPRIQSPAGPSQAPDTTEMLAAGKRARPEPNLLLRTGRAAPSHDAPARLVPVRGSVPSSADSVAMVASDAQPIGSTEILPPKVLPASGWHAVGERGVDASPAVAVKPAPAPSTSPHLAHPQPIGRPGQIILEWSRP
jgi:hypothetical protein